MDSVRKRLLAAAERADLADALEALSLLDPPSFLDQLRHFGEAGNGSEAGLSRDSLARIVSSSVGRVLTSGIPFRDWLRGYLPFAGVLEAEAAGLLLRNLPASERS